MKRIILSALLASALLTSCTSLSNPLSSWEATSSGMSRATPQGEKSYNMLVLQRDEQIYLVLMTKDANGAESAGSGGKETGAVFAPQQGEELFKWTSDYQKQMVQIGAEPFDLQKGGLFLVQPQQGKLVVQQMAIDFQALPAGAEAVNVGKKIKDMTASDRRAAAFFKDYQY
jgi:hypothetical protein